jgi:hypothetical protein
VLEVEIVLAVRVVIVQGLREGAQVELGDVHGHS